MVIFTLTTIILDQHLAIVISTILGGISLLILLRVASQLSTKSEK